MDAAASASEQLDRYLAAAPQEVRDEYQSRLTRSAENAAQEAVKPYQQLEQAIVRLADEYRRQEVDLLVYERKLLSGVFRTCAVQAAYFQGFD